MKKTLMFFFFFVCLNSFAQQTLDIKGTVKDTKGIPLPVVSVLEIGTTNGTSTDFDGNFQLTVSVNSTLSVSFLGFKTQEIKITNQTELNLILEENAQNLDEIVLIGYGEVKKKDLTGSVGTLEVSDLKQAPVASLDQALAGRISGVQVTSSQGRPGSDSSIKIRGTGSLTQSSDPLYVIDGFQLEDFDLSSLDQSDIETFQVLKGPSAVAIYGARGGNGVIIITTKIGKAGQVAVTYNGFYGAEEISKKVDVLSPLDFVDLRYEVDATAAFNNYGDLRLYEKSDGSSTGGIDWQDLTFTDTEVQSHALSVNGGSEDTKYNISLSRYDATGLLPNSGFNRTYSKLKLDQKLSKKFKVGVNIAYTVSETTGLSTSNNVLNPETGDGGVTSARFNLLKDVIQGRPTAGLFLSNEDLINLPNDPDTSEGAPIANPLISAQTQTREDERRTLLFNGYLDYKINKELTLKVSGGLQRVDRIRNSFDAVGSQYEQRNGITRGSITNSERTTNLFSSTLTYKKTIADDHRLNVLVGFDYQDIIETINRVSGSDFPEPNLGTDDLGSAQAPGVPFSFRFPTNRIMSYFGRINYSYSDKYFLTTTLRYDGSSRFGKNNKFGLFPSLAASWRFSNEDFFKDSNVLSDGKLRAEYGEVGNNRIPAFVSKALLTNVTYGLENGIIAGVVANNFANPDIQWETQKQINFGMDLGFLDNRILLNLDYYTKESEDLLLEAPVPANTGFETIFRNIGAIRNEGVEITLNTINIDKAFQWNSNFNISFNRNKTLSLVEDNVLFSNSQWYRSELAQDPFANDFITEVGQPFGLMFGYLDDGLYTAEDFDENGNPFVSVAFGGEEIGYRKYVDVNNDGVINEDDRVVLGNPNPDFFGGFTNNFSYKNFDFSIFFQWSYGNEIYNANRILWTSGLQSNRNFSTEVINRWRTDRTNEENAGATFRSIYDNTLVLTDKYIEDGSYLRLKTVSLGYTFPKKWLAPVFITNCRVYVTGQNLATWTKYTGFDPEVSTRGNGLTSGVDFGAYPRTRTIIGGISLSF